MSSQKILSSSFRDPDGFVFESEGVLLRQINKSAQKSYEQLMSSGLYDALVKRGLLVTHEEIDITQALDANAYKVIRPERLSYISYPFEWCFSQLKDAALCTIKLQQTALEYGMVLKDASAYNIQFSKGKPIFIDTLSFEEYEEGTPWVAYKQFCQHFIGPLALMAYCDISLSQLLRVHIDGMPLDLVSKILPLKTFFKYSLLSHIHLHAKTQTHYSNVAAQEGSTNSVKPRPISLLAFRALMKSIENAVTGINWKLAKTEWGDYYAATNYVDAAMSHKGEVIREFISSLQEAPDIIHDLGANNGFFSRIAAESGAEVIAQDIDPVAVEKNYLTAKKQKEGNILPLVLDLTNPSPNMGWALEERDSFLQRCQNKLVMALALVHHLAISNNVPLGKIAEFFATISNSLIIEFVPKEDSQVKRLLATRKDIFPDYHKEGFEKAFSKFFVIEKEVAIRDSERTLYLLIRK